MTIYFDRVGEACTNANFSHPQYVSDGLIIIGCYTDAVAIVAMTFCPYHIRVPDLDIRFSGTVEGC